MPDSSPRLLVALYGPTSAGKTSLSVDLCLRIRDELGIAPMVVSADSRQVYRYLDIGTSKTMPEQMRGIPHTMIDVAEPVRKLELETFVGESRRRLEACWESGGIPVIVGGTSVYVRALLEGWEVDAVAEARDAVRRDFPRSMAEDAYSVLSRLAPAVAKKIHENNYDAVVNALAQVMSDDREQTGSVATRQVVLAVDRPAADIDRRVAATYDDQVGRGLREEVLDLDERYDVLAQYRRLGQQFPNQVVHTHGYTEWFDVALEQRKSVEDLTEQDQSEVRDRVVARIQAHTRRQRSAIPKLTGVRSVRSAAEAFTAVKAALESGPDPAAPAQQPRGAKNTGNQRRAASDEGRSKSAGERATPADRAASQGRSGQRSRRGSGDRRR